MMGVVVLCDPVFTAALPSAGVFHAAVLVRVALQMGCVCGSTASSESRASAIVRLRYKAPVQNSKFFIFFSVPWTMADGDLPEPSSLYGYTPTTTVCVTFIALFGITTVIHGCEAVAFKMWLFLALPTLAGVLEVVGWLGRFWSSFAPADLLPYSIQTVATIIAPTPLLAANFIILAMLIRYLGEGFSRLSPKLYSIIFTSADILALIIQAFGGAKASHAVSNHEDPEPGAHIMLIGIVLQMVAITFFVLLASEFFIRYYTRRPIRLRSYLAVDPSNRRIDRKMQLMIMGLGFTTVCIFIRTVYRTIELINGFTGRIIRTQIYFNVLDGAMIILASYTLNFLHPGYLLRDVIEEGARAKSLDPLKDNVPLMPVGKTVGNYDEEAGAKITDPFKDNVLLVPTGKPIGNYDEEARIKTGSTPLT
ncbi:RTA1-domain-containing protein [Fomitiporia mediterranea MF3/22]|uniref:RTA1-domain-containing protein n=1 Tax=Fomitiporia mediterranea (strain MF3/22) TaxID=694068 RepID=UPI0004409C81|nr:RTA1-domain-containing protein [Fomitiporia mediterranea MF3/22]EJD05484.1 RTA1-domain-containing protein [Fomitiporia mediterranea MF3/22]